jgi:hypothetical protein
MSEQIVRCPSCAGYGWVEDELEGGVQDCDWCDATGYLYEDGKGIQRRIPHVDYGIVADQLEALEQQRMRELGYQGLPKPPWEQAVRTGTKGGQHPHQRGSDHE